MRRPPKSTSLTSFSWRLAVEGHAKKSLRQLRNPELVKGKTDFGFAQSALRRVNWIAIAGVRVSWSCLDDPISPCAPFAWDTQHRSKVGTLVK